MQLIKNAILFKGEDMLNWPALADEATLSNILGEHTFHPCHSTQAISFGWVPPIAALGENNLVRATAGAFLISFQIEEKKIPASGFKHLFLNRIQEISTREGRKLGGKERKQIKEDLVLELLPKAMSSFSQINALLIPTMDLIVIDTSSVNKAELLLNRLRESMGSLKVVPLTSKVKQPPASVMTGWLRDKFPEGFSFLSTLDLNILSDGDGLSIKIKNDDPASPEIQAHLDRGYQVTKTSIASDDISLTIKSDLSISGIKVSDAVIETNQVENDDDILSMLDSAIVINKAAIQSLYNLINTEFCS